MWITRYFSGRSSSKKILRPKTLQPKTSRVDVSGGRRGPTKTGSQVARLQKLASLNHPTSSNTLKRTKTRNCFGSPRIGPQVDGLSLVVFCLKRKRKRTQLPDVFHPPRRSRPGPPLNGGTKALQMESVTIVNQRRHNYRTLPRIWNLRI